MGMPVLGPPGLGLPVWGLQVWGRRRLCLPSPSGDPAPARGHPAALLVHPLLGGRQPGAQHPLALQRHGAGRGALHPHPHRGVRAQLHRAARLPPAQPPHARQQRQLHPPGAQPPGRRCPQRAGALHGQPLQLQPRGAHPWYVLEGLGASLGVLPPHPPGWWRCPATSPCADTAVSVSASLPCGSVPQFPQFFFGVFSFWGNNAWFFSFLHAVPVSLSPLGECWARCSPCPKSPPSRADPGSPPQCGCSAHGGAWLSLSPLHPQTPRSPCAPLPAPGTRNSSLEGPVETMDERTFGVRARPARGAL